MVAQIWNYRYARITLVHRPRRFAIEICSKIYFQVADIHLVQSLASHLHGCWHVGIQPKGLRRSQSWEWLWGTELLGHRLCSRTSATTAEINMLEISLWGLENLVWIRRERSKWCPTSYVSQHLSSNVVLRSLTETQSSNSQGCIIEFLACSHTAQNIGLGAEENECNKL
jgi:hypothetical protein